MYLAFFSITISKRDELFSTNNCQIKSFNSQDSCPCCSASWTQPALGLADLRVTNIHLLFLILRRKWLHMMFFSHNHYESSLSPSQVGTSSDNIFYFSYFFIISEHSCRCYYRMSNRIKRLIKNPQIDCCSLCTVFWWRSNSALSENARSQILHL